MSNRARTLTLSILLAGGGCSYPKPDFDSPDPAALLPAITDAAKTRDPRSIPHLIKSLDSQDPAVRFAAIRALERITGETLGYDYAAPESERQRQVEGWLKWHEQGRGAPRPPDPVATASGTR